MKTSIYIQKHLLSDIICLLVISGFTYLIVDTWNRNYLEDETTVELVPLSGNPGDELG
jgi:hypothetical protein